MARNHDRITAKGKIVLEYLDRFPDTATKTLAHIIYNDHPTIWAKPETIRSIIRNYRGNNGDRNRKLYRSCERTEHFRDPGEPGNPFGKIPKPVSEGETTPYSLRAKRTLIISDVHIPFHDPLAVEVALRTGLEKEVDAVILNGDIIDFFAISRWLKDPRLRDLSGEIEKTRELLHLVRELFPGRQILYKLGNHEERWDSYLFLKAPELLGVEEFQLSKILHCDQLNIHMFDILQDIRLGDLTVLHGHEFGQSAYSPVNAARGYFLRALDNTIGGHFHHTSEHSWKDVRGRQYMTWSTGCLCNLTPKYRPKNRWNHGFAVVHRSSDESDIFGVRNYKIVNGHVL